MMNAQLAADALGSARPSLDEDPRAVYVGFSTPKRKNALSGLIKLLTNFQASHAWLLLRDETFDEWLVLEAGATGFRVLPFGYFCGKNQVLHLFKLNRPIDAGLHEAAQWLGQEFDVPGLFGIAYLLLTRAKRRVRNPLGSAQAMFCSEAVMRVLQAAAFPAPGDPETTTPRGLYEVLRQAGTDTAELTAQAIRSIIAGLREQAHAARKARRAAPERQPPPPAQNAA